MHIVTFKHHPDRGLWIAPKKYVYRNGSEYVEVSAWSEMEATYKIIRSLMDIDSTSTLKDVTKKIYEAK